MGLSSRPFNVPLLLGLSVVSTFELCWHYVQDPTPKGWAAATIVGPLVGQNHFDMFVLIVRSTQLLFPQNQ